MRHTYISGRQARGPGAARRGFGGSVGLFDGRCTLSHRPNARRPEAGDGEAVSLGRGGGGSGGRPGGGPGGRVHGPNRGRGLGRGHPGPVIVRAVPVFVKTFLFCKDIRIEILVSSWYFGE